MRVLLIDDDPINNIVNQKLLKKFNPHLEITEFLNAKEALRFLEDSSTVPEVILLDINMPEMNGWEFLGAYQALRLNCRLYLLTSSIAQEDMKRAKSFPEVVDFLVKPLDQHKIKRIFT
ncbi:MAG: response regulator [Microscillaceae bacterium]